MRTAQGIGSPYLRPKSRTTIPSSNSFLFSSIVLVIAPNDVRALRMPANCDMASHMQTELAPSRQLNIDADDALCHRWRDHHDILAARLLVERYRHLVVDIAVTHHARHQPSEALLGEGYVGLMRAICRSDPDSGIHFSTYANSWISAAVQDRLLHQMQRPVATMSARTASVADRYPEGVPVGNS